jgi:hypothetical protein
LASIAAQVSPPEAARRSSCRHQLSDVPATICADVIGATNTLCLHLRSLPGRSWPTAGLPDPAKTRLSLAAAAALETAFPHGVFFVALAAVRDADVM